jgi:hypothetical protein
MNLFYKIHLQAFSVISIVLYHSGPTFGQVLFPVTTPALLMCLITQVTSLDASLFLKRFPRSCFFNFGNKSKSGGLMSGLYGGRGSTCHPYFSKISDTAPEAWGRTLSWKMKTPAANVADFFGESLDAKHLAENLCSMPLLQWILEALCLLLSLHSCYKLTITTDVLSIAVTGRPLLGSSCMLTWPSRKQDTHRYTMLGSTTLSPQT